MRTIASLQEHRLRTDIHVLDSGNTSPSMSLRTQRLYAALLAALVAIGVVLSLPYALQLAAMGPHLQQGSGWNLAYGVVLQTTLSYVVIMLGLKLGPAVGLGWPPLIGWRDSAGSVRRASDALVMATVLGTVAAFVLAIALLMSGAAGTQGASPLAPWAVGLASVGAGIQEEVLFRLGAMTIVAWLLSRFRMCVTHPVALVWSANGIAALLFGASHLPLIATGAATPAVVGYVIGVNGIVGLMCGWLFWRKGLIAAMTAHAIFDLVLKVLVPALVFFGW